MFDFSGGALCLDLVNTFPDRQRPETDLFHGYGDLAAWARQGGVLPPGVAVRLGREARRSPPSAAAVFARALGIRDALYRTFSALAAGRPPDAADVDRLNTDLARTCPARRLAWQGDRFAWEWSGPDRLDAMLGPVLRSAAELLTSAEAPRVRECASPTCTWLFVDRSRTHQRRWCSMETCGNRDKARRHYARLREARSGKRAGG